MMTWRHMNVRSHIHKKQIDAYNRAEVWENLEHLDTNYMLTEILISCRLKLWPFRLCLYKVNSSQSAASVTVSAPCVFT